MMHCHYLGSVFRRASKPQSQMDMHDPLKSSGMLGSDPSKVSIVHRSLPTNNVITPVIDSSLPRSRRSVQRLVTPISKITKPTSKINETFPESDDFDSILKSSIPSTSHQSRLTTAQPKEAPNVYYAKYLPPTQPASLVAYEQMNEMLDRLLNSFGDTSRNYEDDFNAFNHIFGEVVRQYFIECGSQGELLHNCKLCFQDARNAIPKIAKHYQKILQGQYEQIKEANDKIERTKPEIEENKVHSDHLLKIINEMRADLARLVKHNDELVKSITVVTNESIQMKTGIEQLDKRIDSKNKKLLDLNDQLQNLSVIAAQYTSDSITFSDNLKQVREQQDNSKIRVEEANTSLRSMMQKVSRIDNEISVLTTEIEKAKVVNEKVDLGTQIDLISRRQFRVKKEEPKPKGLVIEQKLTRKESVVNLFDKVKSQFVESTGKAPKEGVVINTYEDFAKLKQILFKNETQFHIQNEEIDEAQDGYFTLDHPEACMDYIHLFAAKISMDCVEAAIKGRPLKEISTQTLSQQVSYREESNDIQTMKGKSQFVNMIPTDYSMRQPQNFQWLLNTIRAIYHDKEIKNQEAFEKGYSFEDFPKSIFEYAKKKFPLDFLRDQFCWDLQNTAHELKHMSLEVDMFVDFIDEKYNEEQLAFFLLCRKDCLKIGCSVHVRSRDQLESYNEYYLSLDQIELLLPKWWHDRYQRKFYLKLLDFSVPRPAVHLESTKRYVAMHDILMQCVLDYSDDTIERLHEILLECRIVPRMKMPEFTKLMKSLIPDLKQQQVMDFYRATVTKGSDRKEVTVNQFIDLFFQSSILMAICHSNNTALGDRDMIEAVKNEYYKNSKQFIKLLDFFKHQTTLQPDNLTLKTYVDDATRFHSMLVHSLTASDGRSCCLNYYQFMFSVDIIFVQLGMLAITDEETSLASLECGVRENWLDTVFGQQK
ncbi:hypothetical protein TRFO_04971 [Tritrichomonas foetus]|uniref:Uncharacterized protein n=1 Tax=Tritrichomonas foetus TaxID=1144522 RepID=A0A1J4KAS8_9EUKA|nr:hypothetical protein TRFO_04971 [Tritrichomonas foetus]|eukprot:OHT08339.1 hypothetical protein TRFO_04971 [Tritrichomonas foetus]